jgi:hypothetical protein
LRNAQRSGALGSLGGAHCSLGGLTRFVQSPRDIENTDARCDEHEHGPEGHGLLCAKVLLFAPLATIGFGIGFWDLHFGAHGRTHIRTLAGAAILMVGAAICGVSLQAIMC